MKWGSIDIEALIQHDVNRRGLASDPNVNLFTACAGDLEAACKHIAGTAQPAVGIVTGFFIPHGTPPAAETDGPLGALFLAKILNAANIPAVLASDAFCIPALEEGMAAGELDERTTLIRLPSFEDAIEFGPAWYWRSFVDQADQLTHLIAIERVGPSHTLASVKHHSNSDPKVMEAFARIVSDEHRDRCHTMSGRDITSLMSPAHWLFEVARFQDPPITTIGIGDGGNEIGMGKIGWETIHRNICEGGPIACRVPTDFLIVCGVSNWGAYGLAAGIASHRLPPPWNDWFDPDREHRILNAMVKKGPLVDGFSGQATLSVDGLPFDRYIDPLRSLRDAVIT